MTGVALALLTLAGSAAADERPVLVVDATEDRSGAAMAARITVALGPDRALAPVAARFTEALRLPTPTDTSWKQPGQLALAEARELLAKFAYRQAADRARGAQDKLAAAIDDPVAKRLLADLVFLEGLAIAGELGVPAAIPTFALVHRLDPGRTLSPARYAEDVVQAFAAGTAPTAGTGALTVFAVGAAEVLVDGVVAGTEPASMTIGVGPHIVTVRGDNINPAGRRVDAVPGQTVRVDLTVVEAKKEARIARARDRLLAAADDRARADAVASLLGLVDARDAVIITTNAVGDLMARLYTARGGLGPLREIGDDVPGVLRPLRPIAGKPTGPGGGRRPIKPVRPVDERPWWQQRWAKATLGTTAGLIVIGVVTAIVTRDAGTSSFGGMVDVE